MAVASTGDGGATTNVALEFRPPSKSDQLAATRRGEDGAQCQSAGSRRGPELLAGCYRRLSSEGGVFSFARWLDRSGVVVALNLSASDVTVPVPGRGRIVLSTEREREGERTELQVTLAPHEGVIIAQRN
ncbi:DUF3459 domain-containing protein, partial [Methylobacterium oxalidis]